MNDTYLKMCLALDPKVLEDWNWQAGDHYVIKIQKKKKDPVEWVEGTIGDSVLFNGEIGYMDGWECEFNVLDGELRPIPSQEQLQELIRQHNKSIGIGMYDYCLITQIGTWCYRQPTELVQDKDINCLTLMFYMWLKDKNWNGSEWI